MGLTADKCFSSDLSISERVSVVARFRGVSLFHQRTQNSTEKTQACHKIPIPALYHDASLSSLFFSFSFSCAPPLVNNSAAWLIKRERGREGGREREREGCCLVAPRKEERERERDLRYSGSREREMKESGRERGRGEGGRTVVYIKTCGFSCEAESSGRKRQKTGSNNKKK